MRFCSRFLFSGAMLAFFVLLLPLNAYSDVIGTFGTHVSIRPQTTSYELSLIDFDIENELNVTAVISGLSASFHTHFGIAGIEDVILRSNATLGALDVSTLLVFARFAPGATVPFYDTLHFLKKSVRFSLTLGGVTFTNLAQYEDTAAFISLASAYAFGNYINFSGQTPSGISVSGGTGICMQNIANSIKKHSALTRWSVNPDCATEPKPDILFDFQTLQITGLPVAPGVIASAVINCVKITACSLTATFNISDGPIPISASLTFSNLLNPSFGGATITLTTEAGTLTLFVTPTGNLEAITIAVLFSLESQFNSSGVQVIISVSPGIGVTSGTVILSIQRVGMSFQATALFAGGPPAQLSNLNFSLGIPGPLLALEFSANFTPAGLDVATMLLTVGF